MRPTGPVYLNGVPLARELFTKWLDEDPYGTGDSTNVVVDVHRPDSKGFGDAEAAADAWREAVEALDEPDDDDALVAEVLRVADANTIDGAVDTSHLTSYGELGTHVMRELGPGTVAVDYVERCALTWRAKRDEPRGPWWRASTDYTELPAKVSPSTEEEVFVEDDEDDGALMGATNALAARLKAVEERRERELDEEARRVAEDVAALRRARRAADRRAAEAEAARLAAEVEREEAEMRRDVTAALQRRVEELERELALRDAVQEAPAPQSPSKLRVQEQLRKSLERPADRPRRAPPPPTTARDAATALQRVARGNLTRRRTHAVATLEAEVRAAQERLEAEVRAAQQRLEDARAALPQMARRREEAFEAPAPAPLPMDPFAGNAETFVRAAHAFAGDGDQELTIERDQALLVRTAHLADASGWVFAVAVDDGEGEPRCGYVPISHLGGAVSPRFFQDEASEVS